MRSSKIIHVVSCHAEGEVGDVIVGGVIAPPGDTLWEQSRFIARDGGLRDFVLNEPRGGVFRHVNLIVPAKDPRAQIGFIIMEPEDTPPMSGSNSICVATVLLDAGILPMQEPETRLTLEAPGGVIGIVAECRDGKAERISVENVPSFADRLDAPLEVAKSRNAGRRRRLRRRQFRHRRRQGAWVRHQAGRGARTGRNRHQNHRRRQRTARLSPSPKPGLGSHLLLPVRRSAPAGERRDHRPERRRGQARQDRPLADRNRMQRPDGDAGGARRAADRRGLSRPLHHRLGIRLPHRRRDDGRRAPGNRSRRLRPRLDHGRASAHARPERSLAAGLSPRRHLARGSQPMGPRPGNENVIWRVVESLRSFQELI